MPVSLTALTAEVQARCNALTGSSTTDEVIDAAIAAKKVERAGGVLTRTTLDTELQRVINLSGGGSQIEDLIVLAASVEIPADSSGGYTPAYGSIAPFAENGINFTDLNGLEWLKTGYTTNDLGAYPDAVRTPVPNNIYSTRTASGTAFAGATYSEALGKFFIGSAGKIHSSVDGQAWADADTGFSPTGKLISLPSGRVVGINNSTTYRTTLNGTSFSSVSGNPIGISRAVATENGYWYGCNSTQTGWALENSAITSVSVASGSAWNDIAYSPSLRRLVMVGANLCQTNDAAYAGSWTIRTIPAGTWNSVIWVEDFKLFIAVGNGGAFTVSADGITWITKSNLLAVNLDHLTYCSEMKTLYCFGATGASLYTRDGVAWVEQNTAAGSGAINGAAWGGSIAKGLVLAAASSIYKSTPTSVVGVTQKLQLGPGAPYYARIK